MDFQISGKRYHVTPEAVMDSTRNCMPQTADGRHKYFVRLHDKLYPIKQVVQLVTGLKPHEFTSQYALGILNALDFEISDRVVPGTANLSVVDQAGGTLRLLVVFETDEDGWEVASCPTLRGCHSQGRTRGEALKNIREAIRGYLASLREHGLPTPSSSEFDVVEVLV